LRDREQSHFGELGGILPGDGFVARSIEVAGGNLLALWRVEVLQIGGGDGPCVMTVYVGVDDGDRRFGEDARRRYDQLILAGRHLPGDEQGFVLPDNEHVADAALGEGGGGAASATVEGGDILVDLGDEGLRACIGAAGLVQA